jgi:Dna[CI] antecedent, DciA
VIERIGEEVTRALGRFGPAAGMADVVGAWPGAVGAEVARHAWPARLTRDGTLHVATESSVWAFELEQLAPTVLEQLRGALGKQTPSSLRFMPGRLPEAAPEPGLVARLKVPEPGPKERELAEAMTTGIADERLRELVARAVAASLARAASDR